MDRHIGMVDALYGPARGSCTPPEEALAEMDAAGVAVAVVSQCKMWSCERQTLCVDTRLEDVARFLSASRRFAGLAGYNPLDAVESVREMEAARALGFRGTYANADSFGLRLNDARLYPLFAKSAEMRQPALVQVPLAEPDVARSLARIGRDFPELSLAVAHPRPSVELFGLCEHWEGLAYVLDTAALACMCTQQRSLLEEASVVERCFWGSNNAPLRTAAAEIMALDLPLEILERIVRTNALRFFAAPPPGQMPQSLTADITAAER